MRFRPVAACVLAATFAVLAAPALSLGATTTYVGGAGGSWYTASDWSGGTVPTLSDDVIIPNGEQVGLASGLDAYCNTITLQGSAHVYIYDATLEVDGGGGGNIVSSIGTSASIQLFDDDSVLKLSGNQTISGAGYIFLTADDASIEISSGATATLSLAAVQGNGRINGSGTFKLDNGADVHASGILSFGANLSLDDTSTGNTWGANDVGSVLVFNHSATHLVGEIRCESSGTVEFNAQVTTTGPITCDEATLEFNADVTTTGTFTYDLGVLDVLHDVDFVYAEYDGLCANPGSGSGPYTLSGPVGSGSTVVTCP
jgi:hypothetical protein